MADFVIVGAGPVGLWTAIQIKKRKPHLNIDIYERYEQYQRSHILRLDHWSLLLYGRNSKDQREKQFFNELTGKDLGKIMLQPAGSLFIRTNDLEAALKSYAIDQGINIKRELVTCPNLLMAQHPECTQFIAADGAHSKMRNSLLGDGSLKDYPLQYIVEVKYQVKGNAIKLNSLNANKQLNNMAFEYVGKEKNGITPITIRFFLSKEDYKKLPDASFKSPLTINSPGLPESLQKDIKTYLNMRSKNSTEQYCEQSGKLTKLILSLYSAKKFAISKENQAWFLVGDAAMGVPYFRALNSGLLLGSRLAQILCSDNWPANNLKNKISLYNVHQPLHITTEFAIARGKDFLLESYDAVRKMIGANIEGIDEYQEYSVFSCIESPVNLNQQQIPKDQVKPSRRKKI
jgi:2-polyprenyl-6-methoxyphenol hydroxylase-like FAD-dependent oxidoreductase